MKISVIITLKNEESSIRPFLDSLLNQSRKPDEIVMVDGGSTDGTVKIIRQYIKNGAPIKLIIKKGANISKGRNTAIKKTKYDIVASTDLGCRIDKHWLKNICKKFDKNTDVVCGVTLPEVKNDLEKCMAEVTVGKIEEIDEETFLPSSRSVAYRKSAWRKGGGYPEWLAIAEDTYFDLAMKDAGCRFKVAKDAIVDWRMRENLRKLFKQYYLYGKWNRKAGLVSFKNMLVHVVKSFWPIAVFILSLIPIFYFNAILFIPIMIAITVLLFLLTGVKGGLKCYRTERRVKLFFLGMLVKVVVDTAGTMGNVSTRKIEPVVGNI